LSEHRVEGRRHGGLHCTPGANTQNSKEANSLEKETNSPSGHWSPTGDGLSGQILKKEELFPPHGEDREVDLWKENRPKRNGEG